MQSSSRKALVLAVLSAASLSAFASTYNGSCTSEPKEKWMTPEAVQAQYEKQGYTVRRVKSSGTCYEVYAKDKNGGKTELFVNPANGSLVQEAGK